MAKHGDERANDRGCRERLKPDNGINPSGML